MSFSRLQACSLDASKYLRLSIATLAALLVVAVTWLASMVRRIAGFWRWFEIVQDSKA